MRNVRTSFRWMAVLALACPWCLGQETASGEPPLERAALLENGGFESAAGTPLRPELWTPLAHTERVWGSDSVQKLAGAAALTVQPGDQALVICSMPVEFGEELVSVKALVMVQGDPGAAAAVRWLAALPQPGAVANVVLEEPLSAVGSGAWRRLVTNELQPPAGATAVQLALLNPASAASITWDQAQLDGAISRAPRLRVFVNQAGYETNAPKRFVAWSNFTAETGDYRILDGHDEEVLAGPLTGSFTIGARDGRMWDGRFWKGDFSSVIEPGSYVVEVAVGDQTTRSFVVEVADDLLWRKTFLPVWNCFRFHRCGIAVEGVHAACHLDDGCGAADLTGGWHDGASYGKELNPWLLWKLAEVARIVEWRYRSDPAETAPEAVVDELKQQIRLAVAEELDWGAGLLLKTVGVDGSVLSLPISRADYWGPPSEETDNIPASGDERRLQPFSIGREAVTAAALASVGRVRPDVALTQAAERALDYASAQAKPYSICFSAAMDLWAVAAPDKRDQSVLDKLLPAPEPLLVESLMQYEAAFDAGVVIPLLVEIQARADALVKQADAVFGVHVGGNAEHPVYFLDPQSNAGEGNTRRILEAAETVAKANRFAPKPEYLAFIHDQFNWLLGVNPFGLSLMAGVGAEFLPSYYHPYETCGVVAGAVPGALANGIGARAAGDDRPWLDVHNVQRPEARTNGVRLENNALFLSALAHLKRVPTAGTVPLP